MPRGSGDGNGDGNGEGVYMRPGQRDHDRKKDALKAAAVFLQSILRTGYKIPASPSTSTHSISHLFRFITMAKFNKLAGKHVVVIGGSKGIGRGVVEAAIESNARVTLAGSSQQSADAAVSSIKAEYPSAQVVGLGCDLSKPSIEQDLDALLTRAAGLTGEIDHIVFTAADGLPIGTLDDLTPEVAMKTAHMRFLVPLMLGKAAKKHLAGAVNGKPGVGKDKSLILTTGTIASKPAPGWSMLAYFGAGLKGCKSATPSALFPCNITPTSNPKQLTHQPTSDA